MAFLRFSRDRRGYENTFLLHAPRQHGEKERPRLLYWFRTPPHLKVGRTPFDDDAIRLLEDQYPDVEFDWTRLRETPVPSGESGAEGAGTPDAESPVPERRRPRPAVRRQKGR